MASWFRFFSLSLSRSYRIIPFGFLLASTEFQCKDISHESIQISNGEFSASGVSIKQTLCDMDLEYCLMGKKDVFLFSI